MGAAGYGSPSVLTIGFGLEIIFFHLSLSHVTSV